MFVHFAIFQFMLNTVDNLLITFPYIQFYKVNS